MNDLRTLKFPPHLSGHIGLDFINTAEYRGTDERIEFFNSYQDILGWCWRFGGLQEAQAALLYEQAAAFPDAAAAAYQAGIALREALYRVGQGQIEGSIEAADLALINEVLAQLAPKRSLHLTERGGNWVWQIGDLCDIWGPVLLEAAELFASDQIQQLGQCPGCGWLFLDTSRNHQRRWCSMEICGSRAKSRRQYQRRKAGM